MPDLPLTGGCGCGTVRFEIDQPLVAAGFCHCSRCRRRSGTDGPASGRVVPGSVRVVAGEDAVRGWFAGDGLEKAFCVHCGSALFARDHASSAIAAVRLGAFDGDPGVRPSAHGFVADAAVWATLPDDGLARHDGPIPPPATPAAR